MSLSVQHFTRTYSGNGAATFVAVDDLSFEVLGGDAATGIPDVDAHAAGTGPGGDEHAGLAVDQHIRAQVDIVDEAGRGGGEQGA